MFCILAVGSEFLLQGAMWVTRATLPVDYAGLLQGTLVWVAKMKLLSGLMEGSKPHIGHN